MNRRFVESDSGAAAVEFAIISPLLLAIFAFMIDFGMALWVKIDLEQALSSAANYAIVSATNVSASGGATLAAQLGAIAPARLDVGVTVNNGPTYSRNGGAATTGGTASAADACYCPATGSNNSVTWGSSVACGSTCANGGQAGRFVAITMSRTYSPLFASYGYVRNGAVTASSLVRAQ